MAVRIGAARYDIIANTKGFDDGLKRFMSGTQKMGHSFRSIRKETQTASASLDRLGMRMAKLRTEFKAGKVSMGEMANQMTRMKGREQQLSAAIKQRTDLIQRMNKAYREGAAAGQRYYASQQGSTRRMGMLATRGRGGLGVGGAGLLGGAARIGGAGIGAAARFLGPIGAAYMGARGIGAANKAFDDKARSMAVLSALTGSEANAKALYGGLRKFDVETPLMMSDVLRGAMALIPSKRFSQDEIPEMLRVLGEISQGDPEKFRGITRAFGQVADMGMLRAQEKNQFLNAGINPLQLIAEAEGLRGPEGMAILTKQMAAGAITIERLASAFRIATQEGGTFFGVLERRMKTPEGLRDLKLGERERFLQGVGGFFAPIRGAYSQGMASIYGAGADFFQLASGESNREQAARLDAAFERLEAGRIAAEQAAAAATESAVKSREQISKLVEKRVELTQYATKLMQYQSNLRAFNFGEDSDELGRMIAAEDERRDRRVFGDDYEEYRIRNMQGSDEKKQMLLNKMKENDRAEQKEAAQKAAAAAKKEREIGFALDMFGQGRTSAATAVEFMKRRGLSEDEALDRIRGVQDTQRATAMEALAGAREMLGARRSKQMEVRQAVASGPSTIVSGSREAMLADVQRRNQLWAEKNVKVDDEPTEKELEKAAAEWYKKEQQRQEKEDQRVDKIVKAITENKVTARRS